MTNWFGEVFTLEAVPARTSAPVLKKLVALLTEYGAVRIAFKSEPYEHSEEAADIYLNNLLALLEQYGITATVVDKDVLDLGHNGISVHATLEGDVLHFTGSPWQTKNVPGGMEFRRLQEQCSRGRTFFATYTFDLHPSHNTAPQAMFAIEDTFRRMIQDLELGSYEPRVIGEDRMFQRGKVGVCRYRVRFKLMPTEGGAS